VTTSHSDCLNRRLVLGALAALPGLAGLLDASAAQAQTGVPLASWNDGPAKQAILDFVHVTTDPSSKDFVPPEERIGEFDQDGGSRLPASLEEGPSPRKIQSANAVNERGVSTGRRENLIVRDSEVKLFADRLRQEQDLIFGGCGLHDCNGLHSSATRSCRIQRPPGRTAGTPKKPM